VSGCIGIIPARGGSRALPGKNIHPLAGRPLIDYTCEAALRAQCLDRVMVSTDSPEIAGIARNAGVQAPFQRPAELAGDEARSVDVALHALDWVRDNEGYEPDSMMLLQPTSPLRTARHIDEAWDVFIDRAADTVVSVVEVPHEYSPYSVMELDDDRLTSFWKEPLPFDRFRRQALPALYARNGPAVLISRVAVMRERGDFYGEAVFPYFMSRRESVDIDDLDDLMMAELLMGQTE